MSSSQARERTPRGTSAAKSAAHRADLEAARRVLGMAADALGRLSAQLDGGFTQAVGCLLGVKGRVIVSGLGKSGHVARKIAATLASTGTPAYYVHPAEASHGDLGMVTAEDALLMLSNSGENRELSDLVVYAKRFHIPLIAVTARSDSTLARQADIVLALPNAPEACPMGLAPTTSTTMMIALGDALAVALMGRRGFSKDDYRVLHPGGSLGQALLRVGDIMHKGAEIPLVPETAPMPDVLIAMTAHSFGCVGVTDAQERLIGIITDGDLRRHMDRTLLDRTARDIMTPGPKKTVTPDQLAAEALALMNAPKPMVTSLFVLDADTASRKPVGILHIHDCLRAGLK